MTHSFRLGFAVVLVGVALSPVVSAGEESACKKIPVVDKYCGVFAVRDVCAILDMPLSWETATCLVQPRKDGSNSIQELIDAFNRVGLVAVPVRCRFEDLVSFPCPCVLRLKKGLVGHYVTCLSSGDQTVALIDTTRPPKKFRDEDLSALWDGEAVVVAKSVKELPSSVMQLDDVSRYIARRVGATATPTFSNPLAANGLMFSHSLIDFGSVGRFSSVAGTFPFQVAGNDDFRIRAVKTSCRCIADLKYPRSTPAGGQGVIEFMLQPDGTVGRQTRMLYLVPDEEQMPSVQLTISYSVKRDIWLNRSCIDFGVKRQGSHSPARISIVNVARGTGRIERIEYDKALLNVSEVQYEEPCHISSSFEVSVCPKVSDALFSTQLTVQFEEAAGVPLVIPVTGGILPAISSKPSTICFGIVGEERHSRRAEVTINDQTLVSPAWKPSIVADDRVEASIVRTAPDLLLLEITLCPPRIGTKEGPAGGQIKIPLENGAEFSLPYTYCR